MTETKPQRIPKRGAGGARVNSPNAKSMKPPWRKILYIKQDYDDNYVDHSFLSEMKKNVNLPAKNYLTEVHSAGSITQHLSAILTFVGVFVRLYQNEWDSRAVLAGGAACGALGVFVWGAVVRKGEGHTIKSLPGMIKSAVLLTTTLLSMTPILRTLTKDISDDSIWAMTFMMVLVNVLLRDYVAAVGGGGGAIRFPDSIAINAGIFATVLLASRLEENMQVFVFMMGGVGVFGLFPILQRGVKVRIFLFDAMFNLCVLLVEFGLRNGPIFCAQNYSESSK